MVVAKRGSVCSLQPGLSVGSVPPTARPPLPQQPFPEPAMSFAPVLPPPSAPVPTGPGQPTAPAHQVSAGCPSYGCHGYLGLPRPCLSILAGLSPGPANLLAGPGPLCSFSAVPQGLGYRQKWGWVSCVCGAQGYTAFGRAPIAQSGPLRSVCPGPQAGCLTVCHCGYVCMCVMSKYKSQEDIDLRGAPLSF